MNRAALPPLLVVTDRHGAHRPLAETVRAAVAGGARFVWLRDRDLDREARRALALDFLAALTPLGGHLVIGADIALAAKTGAHGVHLGGTAGPRGIAQARAALGPDALIGVSAHGPEEVAAAAEAGADYATLSPIFSTASKPGYGPALGLSALEACRTLPIPVFALGGIDANNASICLDAGAAGIAAMGSPMRAADPEAETRALLRTLGG
ncbi:MAG: thiamine phosphate synthase [Methylorubrum rhodinum]|uniref:thiamine phosphate synthase n=1 Tax=Methylorubrum rhodinum TaxID=29428 RepID=UPI003BAFB0C5